MRKTFRNDYSEVAHAEIFKAVCNIIDEQNLGYGCDKHTKNAEKLILKTFDIKNGSVFFVTGGTQANMLVLSFILKHYEGVICCDTGHINVHETAAVEGSGHKIITIPNENGKLTSDSVRECFIKYTDEHMVKPTAVYISDSTETGTIYSKSELISLRKACDELGLYLFMDGARLGCALTAKTNDLTPKLIGELCDIFYIGGTKNGFMSGEAIVFKNSQLAQDFRYHIKNKGAMMSKTFVVSAQFERAFTDNLYFDIAKRTNEMAEYITQNLTNIVEFVGNSPTNQLFIKLPNKKAKLISKEFGCEVWSFEGENTIIRIVASFNTTKHDCDDLINYIKSL